MAGRILDWINIRRKNISLKGEDKYGHWWIEISENGHLFESYGWWPKNPPDLIDTLTGTEGELNGQTSYGGTPTTDPHHGDSADEEFHPRLIDDLTDGDVLNGIRTFAGSYSGEWRWTFGGGQNCHTFQTSLMEYVGLQDPR